MKVRLHSFLVIFAGLQTKDAQFYDVMVTSLSPEQHVEIQEIINEANRRQKANGTSISLH